MPEKERWRMSLYLGACKRCGGDMSYENDIYGQFMQCLQCSYLEDLPAEASPGAARMHEQPQGGLEAAIEADSATMEASDVA
jgi:hypothetical protein